MNVMILALAAVALTILAASLVSLLRAEHREKVIDTNKKVVLSGGKNINPDAAANGDGIIGENLSLERTVVKNRKKTSGIPVLCLTEQKKHTVYRGRFLDRQILIGRMKECSEKLGAGTLCMKDSKVSHIHCRVYQEQGGYMVEDCCSTNHTWVNGKPVTSAVPLRDGDRLRLAKRTYEVRFFMENE